VRLSRTVTTSYLRSLSFKGDPSPNHPPLVTPRKVVVLPPGVWLVIFTSPSITPIQCSTASPLRQTGTPTGRERTSVSASTRASCSGASERVQREARRSSERVSMRELSTKRHIRGGGGATLSPNRRRPRPMPLETGTPDTFPKLLLLHARERGSHPAIREKALGIWQSWSWQAVRDEIEALACGLAEAGLARGAHIAVIGANRPRLYWTLTAAQSLGAIPVPFYEDAVAQEMGYVFQNAEIEFAVVEDQEQADKLFEIMPQCPKLAHIWYDDPRGLRRSPQPELASYESLTVTGRAFAASSPRFFAEEVARGRGADTAILLYTSGTTGHPKGVVLSHDNLVHASRAYAELEGLRDDEEVLAYLPMAWIGQNLFSYAQWMVVGFRINCIESAETVITDMREIGPTYFFAPPRVLVALLTHVSILMADASWVKRRMFGYFMELARRVGSNILDRRRVGFLDRVKYALGGLLVYAPLKNYLGMCRVGGAYTPG